MTRAAASVVVVLAAAFACAAPPQPAPGFPRLKIPDTLRTCDGKNPEQPDFPKLEAACRSDPACGCADLGNALLARDHRDERGLRLIVESCNAGAELGCDIAFLMAALCGQRGGGACKELEAQGLVPKPDPPDTPRPRPEGCYQLGRAPKPAPCAPTPETWWCRLQADDPPLDLVCFTPDRVHARLEDGAWNEWTVDWLRRDARTFLARDAEGIELVVAVRDADALHVFDVDARKLPLRRSLAVLAERERAPRVEKICRHAVACERAVDSALQQAGVGEESDAERNLSTSRDCEALRIASLARLDASAPNHAARSDCAPPR